MLSNLSGAFKWCDLAHSRSHRPKAGLFASEVVAEGGIIDNWYAAWAEPDPKRRSHMLIEVLAEDICVHDRFSLLTCIDDVGAHIAAAQRFMPGIVMKRMGSIRHCHGSVLADWTAIGPDGQEKMKGTAFYRFAPEVRIAQVTVFRATVDVFQAAFARILFKGILPPSRSPAHVRHAPRREWRLGVHHARSDGPHNGSMLERYSHIRMAAKWEAVAGVTLLSKAEDLEVVPVVSAAETVQ